MDKQHNVPTILIVMGATGDLMARKIIPSLLHLYLQKNTPEKLRIVGFARREFTDEEFQKIVAQKVRQYFPKKITLSQVEKFSKLFTYSQGNFNDAVGYETLKKNIEKIENKWGVCCNKLFYLAVPPENFGIIFKNLSLVRLNEPCGGPFGWTRILVEKPFGNNLKEALLLEKLLTSYFTEEQIYRIDHYLAKEILQAITHFRFSNNLFEPSWSRESIEKIEIKLLEKIGLSERGAFYDNVGALRDVGQNHILEMLAAITMEYPCDMSAKNLHQQRAQIISSLEPWTAAKIKQLTFRAQHEGYRKITHVDPKSTTETYFKLKTELNHPKWQGVPIFMEAGKELSEPEKEIIVHFRQPKMSLAGNEDKHIKNKVIFSLTNDDRIIIKFLTKKPGYEKVLEERSFDFFLYEKKTTAKYVEEYATLLYEAFAGNQQLFVSEKEIEAMWKFTDPIINAWDKNLVPLKMYKPNSSTVLKEADDYIQQNIRPVTEISGMNIGIIGLGKMGANLTKNLMEKGWNVVGYNRSEEKVHELQQLGMIGAKSIEQLAKSLKGKRVIWIMVSAGKAVDDILFGKNGLVKFLNKGDVIIDGGNSFYKDSIKRGKKLAKYNIHFLDVGVSGGPAGARNGACMMIGGKRNDFRYCERLFFDASLPGGYQFFEGFGAGHFIKMIHNGIEYGIMQSIAEGFAILRKSSYSLNLTRVADIYNNGSVIESRLIGWLKDAFELHGENLTNVSGIVSHTGEGEWTVKTAEEMKIKAEVIKKSFQFRVASKKNPSYTGKILSALRQQFGGHSIK